MTIAFDQIPLLVYVPGTYAEFDPSRAVKGVAIQPHDAVLLAQILSTGTLAASTPQVCESADEGRILGGEGSQLAAGVAAYKAVDPLTRLWVIAVADNGAGVQATGSITWAGTATESRELPIYIAGRRIVVAVTKGDTAAAIETAAVAAFALVRDLPVTVAENAGTGLDFTARHKGTIGNTIAIGVCQLPGENVPAGITVTVNAMASGATDPSYAAAITALAEDQYHTLATGIATGTVMGLLETEYESRWGAMRAIEGQIFGAVADSAANLTTAGNARNSFASTLIGVPVSAKIATPFEVACAVAAVSAYQAQVDPSRASTGVKLGNISGPKRGTDFTWAQKNTILSDGVSTLDSGADGSYRVQRLITTYQSNAQGVPDTALQDLTTVRLLAALRYSARVRVGTKFARFKLADDDAVIPPGQPIVTPRIMRAELISLFQDWQQLGWVEGLEQFKSELLVERDGSDPNRLNVLMPPNLINNLLVTAMKIAFQR